MILQIIFNGMALGCIYALIALCFVIIYKATDVVNFAQGELMMLSAYMVYSLILMGLSFCFAFMLAILFSIIVNFIISRLVMRPLIGYHLFPVVIATLAIGIIIRGIVVSIWGHETKPLNSPFVKVITLKYFSATSHSIGIIAVTIFLIIILALFFKYTKIGTALRATSEDVIASYLCGISVKKIFNLSWIISGGVVGTIAGVLVAPTTFLSPHLGHIGLLAFPAAVLGGFESIPGALIGGVLLGILELLAAAYLPEAIKSIFPWMALYLILIIRPEGMFGSYEKIRKV